MGTAFDITELKRAEQHAIRTERLAAMGRLAAALAHEINNPLQIIQNHLDLVLDFSLRHEEEKQCLDAIRHEFSRLRDITYNVLGFARPKPVVRRPVAVAELVQRVLALVSEELEQGDIRLTTDWQDVPPVLAEPNELTQVFLNLVMNAIESTPKQGHLHTAVYPQDGQVAISFTNSGPAIPPEVMERIFEPFFTTKPEGSGLGLWVSYQLAQQHSGSLTIENLENGQGAVSTVRLPPAPELNP